MYIERDVYIYIYVDAEIYMDIYIYIYDRSIDRSISRALMQDLVYSQFVDVHQLASGRDRDAARHLALVVDVGRLLVKPDAHAL